MPDAKIMLETIKERVSLFWLIYTFIVALAIAVFSFGVWWARLDNRVMAVEKLDAQILNDHKALEPRLDDLATKEDLKVLKSDLITFYLTGKR